MRTCLPLLVVGLMLSLDRESLTTLSAAEHPSAPHNIIVDEPLTDVVVEMLRSSDTFRNQCRLLGLIRRLRVRVSLDPARNPLLERPAWRATCTIRRYQFGRIEADVRLHTAMEAENLIAHELEHVREYIDGMNYLAASVQHPARVWTTVDGHYETARAIDAGQQVASEMLRNRGRHATTLARRSP